MSNTYFGVPRTNYGYYYLVEHTPTDTLLHDKYKCGSGVHSGYDRVSNEKAQAIINALVERRDLTETEESL